VKNRCGYCHELGHNQRTCLKLRLRAAQNPDNNWLQDRVQRMDETGRDRRCSYCKDGGHNRATCKQLENDKFTALVANAQYRKNTLELFKKHGIGLGTLFELNSWGDELLLMVDEIKWDNILYQHPDRSIMVNNHGEADSYHSFVVDKDFWRLLESGNLKILVPAEIEHIGVGITPEWEIGMSNIKAAFSDWE